MNFTTIYNLLWKISFIYIPARLWMLTRTLLRCNLPCQPWSHWQCCRSTSMDMYAPHTVLIHSLEEQLQPPCLCLAHFIQIAAKHQKITGICLLLQYQRRLKVPLRDPEEHTQKHIEDQQVPHYPIWAPGLWQGRETSSSADFSCSAAK